MRVITVMKTIKILCMARKGKKKKNNLETRETVGKQNL